jgi:hypothetical protein
VHREIEIIVPVLARNFRHVNVLSSHRLGFRRSRFQWARSSTSNFELSTLQAPMDWGIWCEDALGSASCFWISALIFSTESPGLGFRSANVCISNSWMVRYCSPKNSPLIRFGRLTFPRQYPVRCATRFLS